MTRTRSPLAVALASATLSLTLGLSAGCATQPVDVSRLQVNVPAASVPKKSRLPVYIVLDPAKVPESYEATGKDMKPVQVTNLRAFVERDLRAALSGMFDTVEVVAPGFSQPGAYYLLADVQISQIRFIRSGDGQLRGRMEWDFVLSAVGRPQHIYRKAGTAGPSVAGNDPEGAIAAMFQAAASGIVTAYAERNIYGRVDRLEQSLAPALK